MTHTVLVTDYDFPDLSIECDVFGDNVEIISAQATTEEDILDVAREVDVNALLTQYAPIGEQVFEKLPNLRAVGRYGIGVDTIDLNAATAHGVQVVNVPDYCEDEVSTHAFALLLSCERRTAFYDAHVKAGTWDWKEGQPIYRLRGRTLGLAGFGRIPQQLVEKARPFGFEMIAYDPYIDDSILEEYGVKRVDFEGLLKHSDVVSVHTPLNDETRGLFDAEAFAVMDDAAILINTSRGSVVDPIDLAEALESGELRGAGIDVLPEEPPNGLPLLNRNDVVLTPHVAWYSEESIDDLRQRVAADISRILRNQAPKNPINNPH